MKYRKCSRCGLNWITSADDFCRVCLDELHGVKSIFDVDDECDPPLCPLCNVNPLVGDEPVCAACRKNESR